MNYRNPEINESQPFDWGEVQEDVFISIGEQRNASYVEAMEGKFVATQQESFFDGKEPGTTIIRNINGIDPPDDGPDVGPDPDDHNPPKPDVIPTPDVNAETAEDIANIESPETTVVGVKTTEALNALDGNTYYKSIVIDGENISIDNTITLKANEEIYLDGITVTGEKGNLNGKVTFASKELTLSDITIENGSTVYNAFEGYQSTNDPNYTGLEKLDVYNMTVDNPSLKHNVVNVYTPADNAVINIKNSTFNLTVDNSNVMRLANYMNSENVTVNFTNVEWTYENSLSLSSVTSWPYAGLIIYQPASSDVALTGDYSKIATWTFNFENCKYNGEKVTSVNFGEHNQVIYGYNLGGDGAVTDISDKVTVNFS